MHLSYIDPSESCSEEMTAVINETITRRGPHSLVPLDLTLLHSPPVMHGWNVFMGSIRTGTTLPPYLSELVICTVAVLNRAYFEWKAHCPLALRAGVSRQTLQSLLYCGSRVDSGGVAGMDSKSMAALDLTIESTKSVRVAKEVMERAKTVFNEREIVEIIATIGAYNCVSRFLVALDINECADVEVSKWEVVDVEESFSKK